MTPFSSVVGHERVKSLLHRALAHGTVHSGYLLSGPEGVGKRLLATACARAFLCLGQGGEPCGVCRSCSHPAGAPHPDYAVVAPEERRKSISIEQVRELCAWLTLSPAWGRRKAALVEPADAMTREAANALLKTLEEPPEGRLLLLVTARPGSLPATVISRCQQIALGGLAEEEVAEVLRRAGWPPQTARQAAALAEGSPGLALSRDGKAWQDAAGTAGALVEALCSGDRGAALAFAEGVREGREQALLALHVLLARLRQAVRRSLVGSDVGMSDLPEAVRRMPAEEVCGLMERALDLCRRLEGNANPRLALSTLLASGGADRRR